MKAETSELQRGIIFFSYEHRNCNRFFNLMRWSFSMQPIKFTVTALIPFGRGSNQSATQFKFWTDFSHGNEVACLSDQRSVSGALSNRKHGLFQIRYFENGPLEPGYMNGVLAWACFLLLLLLLFCFVSFFVFFFGLRFFERLLFCGSFLEFTHNIHELQKENNVLRQFCKPFLG